MIILRFDMYHLIEYNNYYKDNVEKVENDGKKPIILFYMYLSDKNSSVKELERIRYMKKNISRPCAVIVILEKLENYIPGFLNSLKSEIDIVIGMGGLNKVNRFFLEQTNIDFLMDPQNSFFNPKIDFIHHFNSGINHVLCNYAKEKGIGFLFSLNFVENYSRRDKAREFGRINQNIAFASKYNISICVDFIIESYYNIKSLNQLSGVLSLFNISPQKQKNSLYTLEETLNVKKRKNSKYFIRDGIEIAE